MKPLSDWWIFHILGSDFTFSKRQLGQVLLAIGIVGGCAILAIDVFNVGREGGIGPAQRAALIVLAGVALVGLTLVPLGDEV